MNRSMFVKGSLCTSITTIASISEHSCFYCTLVKNVNAFFNNVFINGAENAQASAVLMEAHKTTLSSTTRHLECVQPQREIVAMDLAPVESVLGFTPGECCCGEGGGDSTVILLIRGPAFRRRVSFPDSSQ